MKKTLMIVFLVVMNSAFAAAHGEDTFAKAEELIKQKMSCNELIDDELEIIGDYYMEQMHPGELHELMDVRMGGEGSESLRLVHIRMARAFYCGEHDLMSGGMMNMMMGRNGMMGSASDSGQVLGITGRQGTNAAAGFGMMGSGMGNYAGLQWLGILYWIIISLLVGFLGWWIINAVRQKSQKETPSDILKRRYAKGEITKKQYEKIKKELGRD